MKENKGRFPWKEGMNFEAVEPNGKVFQIATRPKYENNEWYPLEGLYVGNVDVPKDAANTLIERYPSDQSETAPFVFSPEHIGKRVRHIGNGVKGIILNVDKSRRPSDQLQVLFEGGIVSGYSIKGESLSNCLDVTIVLDESETAPAETDAPDLQARVESLERLTSRMDSAAEIIERHNDAIWDYRMRIEALEAEVKELRESREMVHKFVPARTYLDDMRFVVPGAKSDVGVLSFTGGIETPAEPDPTAQIAEIEQNERLLPIKQFPWTIEYKSTPIDPTAQKIEALKLLFPWRDGCEFMTVDGRDGHVWQWTVEPVKGESNCWTALGSDPQARRVGEIGLDPELCQILIKRNDGE